MTAVRPCLSGYDERTETAGYPDEEAGERMEESGNRAA